MKRVETLAGQFNAGSVDTKLPQAANCFPTIVDTLYWKHDYASAHAQWLSSLLFGRYGLRRMVTSSQLPPDARFAAFREWFWRS